MKRVHKTLQKNKVDQIRGMDKVKDRMERAR